MRIIRYLNSSKLLQRRKNFKIEGNLKTRKVRRPRSWKIPTRRCPEKEEFGYFREDTWMRRGNPLECVKLLRIYTQELE